MHGLFQQRVGMFDHGIKTRESNECRGAKPLEIHCFKCFATVIKHAEGVVEIERQIQIAQYMLTTQTLDPFRTLKMQQMFGCWSSTP